MFARRVPALVLASALLITFASGTDWVGQRRVNPPNGAVPDGAPAIAVASDGSPWVAWDTKDTARLRDTTMALSVWQDTGWDGVRGVGPNQPGVNRRINASIAFDSSGRAWLAWDDANYDNSNDIGSSFWADTAWSDEVKVNGPGSSALNFRPHIACGGGQVWCVWYGGPTDTTAYSVYASRWNSAIHAWESETQVSPADGLQHWWCDVAVDSAGTPHVVWCTYPLYTVFCSYFDGQQWVTPIPVNDTTKVMASPWASPRIVIDRDGVMHVSFTGARVGAVHRDIFYTRNDGSGWESCQMVTRDSLYHEWTSDIAADCRNDVWIAWDRQNEGPDQFRIYAAHYDGLRWSTEERLDSDSAYYDFGPVICLDQQRRPWVVWSGISNGSGQTGDVFYNRVAVSGCDDAELGQTHRDPMLHVSTCVAGPVMISFDISSPAAVDLAVFDMLGRRAATLAAGRAPAGRRELLWEGGVPAGVYFCRLRADEVTITSKFIQMGQ